MDIDDSEGADFDSRVRMMLHRWQELRTLGKLDHWTHVRFNFPPTTESSDWELLQADDNAVYMSAKLNMGINGAKMVRFVSDHYRTNYDYARGRMTIDFIRGRVGVDLFNVRNDPMLTDGIIVDLDREAKWYRRPATSLATSETSNNKENVPSNNNYDETSR